MIRILVVDDHSIVREGLRAVLSRESDLEVIGEAGSGQEAVEAFSRLKPDVTILDLRLPDMEGKQVISSLLGRDPHALVLVLSTYGGEEDVAGCLAAGAKGYLLKGASRREVTQAVRRVASGFMAVPAELSLHLARRLHSEPLTDREKEVLVRMAQGRGNGEIARELGIALCTVKGHVTHLMAKLGVKSRTQALLAAMQRGLLREP